jgi:hypothetical protein
VLPAEESAVGQRLRAWLRARSLHPRVVCKCDDSTLAKEFGRRGLGFFVAPTVLERDIDNQYGVRGLGATQEVVEEFLRSRSSAASPTVRDGDHRGGPQRTVRAHCATARQTGRLSAPSPIALSSNGDKF